MSRIQNKLSAFKTDRERKLAWSNDVLAGKLAFYKDGNSEPLVNLPFEWVDFVAGFWRVQVDFPYPIQRVRDQDFVLLEKLPRMERNLFEFYLATRVGVNCYGPFIVPDSHEYVAKYDTDRGTYWAYGDTLERARAFLGIRLYDEFMDVIHVAACQKKLRGAK